MYFGVALFEVIDDSPDNPNLKFMIARPFNAGINEKNWLILLVIATILSNDGQRH